jgi:uncharacterized protein (TIGR02246 family)
MSTIADPSADVQAIKVLLSTYERSLNESDVELAVSVYAPDGMFIPLFAPSATGAELAGSYEQIFQTIKLEVTFTVDDVQVDGDTAHALTRSEGHVIQLASGDRGPEANRELFVFQRRNSEWKVARYMFNKISAPGA